jgi:hypothetical protein
MAGNTLSRSKATGPFSTHHSHPRLMNERPFSKSAGGQLDDRPWARCSLAAFCLKTCRTAFANNSGRSGPPTGGSKPAVHSDPLTGLGSAAIGTNLPGLSDMSNSRSCQELTPGVCPTAIEQRQKMDRC